VKSHARTPHYNTFAISQEVRYECDSKEFNKCKKIQITPPSWLQIPCNYLPFGCLGGDIKEICVNYTSTVHSIQDIPFCRITTIKNNGDECTVFFQAPHWLESGAVLSSLFINNGAVVGFRSLYVTSTPPPNIFPNDVVTVPCQLNLVDCAFGFQGPTSNSRSRRTSWSNNQSRSYSHQPSLWSSLSRHGVVVVWCFKLVRARPFAFSSFHDTL